MDIGNCRQDTPMHQALAIGRWDIYALLLKYRQRLATVKHPPELPIPKQQEAGKLLTVAVRGRSFSAPRVRPSFEGKSRLIDQESDDAVGWFSPLSTVTSSSNISPMLSQHGIPLYLFYLLPLLLSHSTSLLHPLSPARIFTSYPLAMPQVPRRAAARGGEGRQPFGAGRAGRGRGGGGGCGAGAAAPARGGRGRGRGRAGV
jgi:hypothetical protein